MEDQEYWSTAQPYILLHLFALAATGIALSWPIFLVVEQKRVVVVERVGKFHAVLTEGFHILVPGFDKIRPVVWRETEPFIPGRSSETRRVIQTLEKAIDLRERLMDFPDQSVITRDNVEIKMHPMVLYKIIDPVKVAYEVYDLRHAVEKLVQTTLRSIIGDMSMDDTLASREEINKRLMTKVGIICHNWGCELTRVELLEIAPASVSIENAMHQQLQGERYRRSNVKQADGERIKLKTHAEGHMSSVIAVSKGEMEVKAIKARAEADSKILIATAEANALQEVCDALSEFGLDPSDYMISLKFIDAFTAIASQVHLVAWERAMHALRKARLCRGQPPPSLYSLRFPPFLRPLCFFLSMSSVFCLALGCLLLLCRSRVSHVLADPLWFLFRPLGQVADNVRAYRIGYHRGRRCLPQKLKYRATGCQEHVCCRRHA